MVNLIVNYIVLIAILRWRCIKIISLLYLFSIIFFFIIEKFTNKRVKHLLPWFTIIFLVIVMGGTTQNPDTEIYESIYQRDFFTKDIGFGILIYIFKSMGFSLNFSRLIMATTGVLLINQTAKKYLKNTTYFYILYAIHPFLLDVVQVRNFLAMSLFIYAIPFLLENKKTGRLKYIILVLIAASMQKVALLYLPIIFLVKLQKKKFLKFLLIVSVVCSIFIGLNRFVLMNFINFYMISLSQSLAGLENFLDINTRYGWIILWGEQFASFGLVFWANKTIRRKVDVTEVNKDYYEKAVSFTELIYNINLYMFIFLPLFIIDATFTRIIRNIMPLNIMVFCINNYLSLRDKRIKTSNFKFTFTFMSLFYQIILFCLFSRTYWDTIVVSVFSNNWIWDRIIR